MPYLYYVVSLWLASFDILFNFMSHGPQFQADQVYLCAFKCIQKYIFILNYIFQKFTVSVYCIALYCSLISLMQILGTHNNCVQTIYSSIGHIYPPNQYQSDPFYWAFD